MVMDAGGGRVEGRKEGGIEASVGMAHVGDG